jgi:excinuclease ABC subunit A
MGSCSAGRAFDRLHSGTIKTDRYALQLRDLGTRCCVEHDEETILHDDHVIDMARAPGSMRPHRCGRNRSRSPRTKRSLTGSTCPDDGDRYPKKRGSADVHHDLRLPGEHSRTSRQDPVGLFHGRDRGLGSGKSTLLTTRCTRDAGEGVRSRPTQGSTRASDRRRDRKVIVMTSRPIGRTPRFNPTHTESLRRIRSLIAGLKKRRHGDTHRR